MQQDLKKGFFLEVTKGKDRTRHLQSAAVKSKGRVQSSALYTLLSCYHRNSFTRPFSSFFLLLVYFWVFRIFFVKRQIHGYLYSSRVVTVVVEMYTHEIRLSVGLKLPLTFLFSWYQLLRSSGMEFFCNTAAQEANLSVDCIPQTRIEWLSEPVIWEIFVLDGVSEVTQFIF